VQLVCPHRGPRGPAAHGTRIATEAKPRDGGEATRRRRSHATEAKPRDGGKQLYIGLGGGRAPRSGLPKLFHVKREANDRTMYH
jgi:hypothetical protein